eukprot:9545670-Lingulodinium_polyedra.AAC.1
MAEARAIFPAASTARRNTTAKSTSTTGGARRARDATSRTAVRGLYKNARVNGALDAITRAALGRN